MIYGKVFKPYTFKIYLTLYYFSLEIKIVFKINGNRIRKISNNDPYVDIASKCSNKGNLVLGNLINDKFKLKSLSFIYSSIQR